MCISGFLQYSLRLTSVGIIIWTTKPYHVKNVETSAAPAHHMQTTTFQSIGILKHSWYSGGIIFNLCYWCYVFIAQIWALEKQLQYMLQMCIKIQITLRTML